MISIYQFIITTMLSLSGLSLDSTKSKILQSPFINPITILSGCIISAGIIGGIYITYKYQIGYYRSDILMKDAFNEDEFEIYSKGKKTIVLGCSCSGKSTLSKKIAKKIPNIKHVELDDLYYLPGWNWRSDQDFESIVRNTLSKNEKWVIDGEYPEVHHMLWSDVEVVIWLDYDFWVVFWRSIKRTTYQILTGQKVCNGNINTFYSTFIECKPVFGGIPGWVIKTHSTFKEKIAEWTVQYPHVKIIIIPSPNHCDYWFNKLKK